VFPLRVAQGLRPTLPPTIPADHRALLESAWQHDPTKRPTMAATITAIDRLSDLPEPVVFGGAPTSPVAAIVSGSVRQLLAEQQRLNDELKRVTQLLVDEQNEVHTTRQHNIDTASIREQIFYT
jgi:hypothetical protein